MKITESTLKRIIKEEVLRALREEDILPDTNPESQQAGNENLDIKEEILNSISMDKNLINQCYQNAKTKLDSMDLKGSTRTYVLNDLDRKITTLEDKYIEQYNVSKAPDKQILNSLLINYFISSFIKENKNDLEVINLIDSLKEELKIKLQ